MPIILLALLVGFFLSLVTVYFVYKKASVPKLSAQKALADTTQKYEFISHRSLMESTEHPELLSRIQTDLKNSQVKSVYLIHGTFVGEDPFHMAAILERSFPNLKPEVIQKIRKGIKQGQNLMAKDLGNFVDEHIELLKTFTEANIHNFAWSSANHHYARLEGCINLIQHLSERHVNQDRVLLIGHSHAGQIFAILSQLFSNPELRKHVIEIFPDFELELKLGKIQNLNFDFVTLGTPARYPWFLAENMRLLHIINHRGSDLLGGSFKDAVFTSKGDYIQQWGIAGSDMKAAEADIRELNQKLDVFLGAGANREILLQKVKMKNRLHTDGIHLLVDYGDKSKLPNFVNTAFGHGTYTRLKYMPFLLATVREKFYLVPLTSANAQPS